MSPLALVLLLPADEKHFFRRVEFQGSFVIIAEFGITI
jgi:hypothetical protein